MSEAVRLAAHSHGDLFPVNTSKQPAVYKIGLASAKPAEQPLAPAGAAEAKTSKTCKKVKEKCVQFTTRTEVTGNAYRLCLRRLMGGGLISETRFRP